MMDFSFKNAVKIQAACGGLLLEEIIERGGGIGGEVKLSILSVSIKFYWRAGALTLAVTDSSGKERGKWTVPQRDLSRPYVTQNSWQRSLAWTGSITLFGWRCKPKSSTVRTAFVMQIQLPTFPGFICA
jgi:hypothetical protein